MENQIKYPLTEEAKATARQLVDAWSHGGIEQLFIVKEIRGDGQVLNRIGMMHHTGDLWDSPPVNVLMELAVYSLIELTVYPNSEYQILLLQELRNAVERGFVVSDYFLTTTAVGNIFTGNPTINAPVQGVGQALAPVTQNVKVVAGEIRAMLGETIIEQRPELKQALQEFEAASTEEVSARGRRLIKKLADVLEGVKQAAGVVQAIIFLSQFIQAYI